jgi:hypothetical protein
MTAYRVLLAASMIASTSLANALEPTDGFGVGIAFVGRSIVGGMYSTEALSVSVGTGEGAFTSGAWANSSGVATAVGSSGTVILGPLNSAGYETFVCTSIQNCLFASDPIR